MSTLSEENAREYVRDQGLHCPYCQSNNISVTERDIEVNRVICYDCKETWDESLEVVACDGIYLPDHAAELLEALKMLVNICTHPQATKADMKRIAIESRAAILKAEA